MNWNISAEKLKPTQSWWLNLCSMPHEKKCSCIMGIIIMMNWVVVMLRSHVTDNNFCSAETQRLWNSLKKQFLIFFMSFRYGWNINQHDADVLWEEHLLAIYLNLTVFSTRFFRFQVEKIFKCLIFIPYKNWIRRVTGTNEGEMSAKIK